MGAQLVDDEGTLGALSPHPQQPARRW